MDLSSLTDFNLVATHGGFGKASRASGRPKATLSRRVMDLERSLGLRLIERGARSLRLTDEGKALHEGTYRLLEEVTEVGESISAGVARPRGHLRVSAPVLLSHTVLGRIAAEFAQAYPDVQLHITAEDRNVDLVEDGYDIVVRVNPRPDSSLVGRCFAHDEMLVVAHPAFPIPISENAGSATQVLAVAMTSMRDSGLWLFMNGENSRTIRPDIRLWLSSLLMVRDAVRAGAGAAILPRSMLRDDIADERLVVWGRLPERSVELWVLHNSRRLVSAKVSAFVTFLAEAFPDRLL